MKPQKHGSFHQKHSLGQNFIEDEALLSQLAELSLVTAEDCVLEIGPGFGALTKPLAERAKQVVSLEIDRTLIPILNVTLEKYANARVICDDVMRTNLSALVAEAFGADCPSLRVAANLPYYITTDVLTKLMRIRDGDDSKRGRRQAAQRPGRRRIRSVGRDVPISLPCDARARCAGGLLQPAAQGGFKLHGA